jgi:hypothetical protein
MAPSSVLIAIAFVSVAWGTVSSIVIVDALQKRGVKVKWIFLRVLLIKYVGQYRKITRTEAGRTGPWFYSFVFAMNLALVTAIAGLVLRAA